MYVNIYIYIYIYIYISIIYIYIYIYSLINITIFIYIHIYINICLHINACSRLRTQCLPGKFFRLILLTNTFFCFQYFLLKLRRNDVFMSYSLSVHVYNTYTCVTE